MVLKITDRAHDDLQEIENYSLAQWGRKTANRYMENIQTALSLLQEHPTLFRHKSDISKHLKFYRVREHYLIGIELQEVLIVLTITHGEMDLPNRVFELEPTLRKEAELLHQRLVSVKKKQSPRLPGN